MLNALARHARGFSQTGYTFYLGDNAQGSQQSGGVAILGVFIEYLVYIGADLFGMIAKVLFFNIPERPVISFSIMCFIFFPAGFGSFYILVPRTFIADAQEDNTMVILFVKIHPVPRADKQPQFGYTLTNRLAVAV